MQLQSLQHGVLDTLSQKVITLFRLKLNESNRIVGINSTLKMLIRLTFAPWCAELLAILITQIPLSASHLSCASAKYSKLYSCMRISSMITAWKLHDAF